jgi:hypothetical protein
MKHSTASLLLVGGLAAAAQAGARPGSARAPFVSLANPAEPGDNADHYVSRAPRFLRDGGNRVLIRTHTGERLEFYVAGPDGTGYHRYPDTALIRHLGRGEYALAAAAHADVTVPGRRPHFKYGPLRVTFRSRHGHRIHWELLQVAED